MSHLVWLASYPKSGNTWMRAFLTAYLAGPDSQVDLDGLDASLHAASRQLFDRVVGFGSADLTTTEIDDLRPEVYRAFDREATGPLFIKVHEAWRRTAGGAAVFPPDATRIAVVIVRNPLAIVPSLAHHYSLTIDEAIARMSDATFTLASQAGRLVNQLPQPIGTWSEQVSSWLDQAEMPVHLVRYEELRSAPQEQFSAVLTACGIAPEPGQVASALERTSFERLQGAERESGFRERPAGARAFFRQGRADGWRAELTAEQARLVIRDHREVMRRLGYAPAMDDIKEAWQTPAFTELDVSIDTAAVKTGSGGDATGVTPV